MDGLAEFIFVFLPWLAIVGPTLGCMLALLVLPAALDKHARCHNDTLGLSVFTALLNLGILLFFWHVLWLPWLTMAAFAVSFFSFCLCFKARIV